MGHKRGFLIMNEENPNKLKEQWNLVAVIIVRSGGGVVYPQVVDEDTEAPRGP